MRCGIDFGTSNTTMAVVYQNESRLIALEKDSITIPTALFFTEKNKNILFGRAAVKAYLEGVDGRFMRSLKRVLGTDLMDQTIAINGVRTDFDTVIGRFLTHIKHTAEAQIGKELTEVTLGRPVHFQDNDSAADSRAQEQLQRIAEKAGFKNIRFQFEPIAAALAHERHVIGEKLALVIDIGGGTSDFSVIRLSNSYANDRDRSKDILANHGVRIGGNDCDRIINLDILMPLLGLGTRYGNKKLDMPARLYYELSEWAKVNWCYTPQNLEMVRMLLRESEEPRKIKRLEQTLEHQLGHKVLDIAESIKIDSSELKHIEKSLAFIEYDLCVISDCAHIDGLLEKILQPVHAAMMHTLRQANIATQDIAVIVLTGGSTALPVFQRWLTAHFSHATVLEDNRLGSVGLGLVL